MFTLPSLSNLIISTIAFFIAAWYVNRYLDEQEIPRGMTRGVLVFTFASILSWGVGEGVDWALGGNDKPPATEMSQLLKAAGQAPP